MSTLKEKFYKEIRFMERAEICEKIADNYAIEFAEWVECSKTYYTPIKELLEIFKKEKGY